MNHYLHPSSAPDALSEGVLLSLTRKFSRRFTWRPAKTVVLGLISGGLLPLIVLPKVLRDSITAEKTHLWHFAEWLRLQYPGPESERFQEATAKLKFRWSVWIGALLLATLAIVWAWTDIAAAQRHATIPIVPFGSITLQPLIQPITPQFLFDFTARLPHIVKDSATLPRVLLVTAEGFMLLLIAAHVLCLWQIASHTSDVRKVVEKYNALVRKRSAADLETRIGANAASAFPALALLDLPRMQLGLDIRWVGAIVGLLVLGAWWGVPMVLAAAAQARYINVTGRNLRRAFAMRAFNALAQQRPVLSLPLPEALRGTCVNEECDANIGQGAQFCKRCGARVMMVPLAS